MELSLNLNSAKNYQKKITLDVLTNKFNNKRHNCRPKKSSLYLKSEEIWIFQTNNAKHLAFNFLVIGFDMIIIFLKVQVGNLLKLLKNTTGQKQSGIKPGFPKLQDLYHPKKQLWWRVLNCSHVWKQWYHVKILFLFVFVSSTCKRKKTISLKH